MSETFVIRNATSGSIRLLRAETFEDATLVSAPSQPSFASNITTLLNNITSTLRDKTNSSGSVSVESKKTISSNVVNAQLGALTFTPVEIPTQSQGSEKCRLQLIFSTDAGEPWNVSLPCSSAIGQQRTLRVPVSDESHHAIYVPESHFLGLYEPHYLSSWMKVFHDSIPLSALSIPGTHNSPACSRALPSVRCQAVAPREQMLNGVRFLDIRVQPADAGDIGNETLYLVHGAFPVALDGARTFRALVADTQEFLRRNPSETVIMSVKREGIGGATDQQLSVILRDHYVGRNADMWYTEPRVPTLGEARGKIVLMRRFVLDDRFKNEAAGKGWCLNAERWAYNSPHCTAGHVCVQDVCEMLDPAHVDAKIKYCFEHFERTEGMAITTPLGQKLVTTARPLYLNFLSAANFWKMGCWPENIAVQINPAVLDFLCRRYSFANGVSLAHSMVATGGLGIVICDWIGKDNDWDLVRCIIETNGHLLQVG